MRIATFNILHGRTVGDGVDPRRLRDCVRRLDPDVLALQEVDFDQPRSGRADLTAAAAEAMGAVEHRFVAAISGTPGPTPTCPSFRRGTCVSCAGWCATCAGCRGRGCWSATST